MIFVVLAVLICVPAMLTLILKPKGYVPGLSGDIIQHSQDFIPRIFAVALITALGFAFLKKKVHLVILFLCSIVISIFLVRAKFWMTLFGVMLPTLLHVYVFTIFFMWYGAIKSKSVYGYLGVLCMLLSVFIIASLTVNGNNYIIPDSMVATYMASNIQAALAEVVFFTNQGEPGEQIRLFAPGVVKIQMFIAFAYTYHYLNWFSKTSIIKWHLITRKESIVIFVIWVISVGLYIYDFQTGFTLLLFISVLHVFLEFPLNYISIAGTLKNYIQLPGRGSGPGTQSGNPAIAVKRGK